MSRTIVFDLDGTLVDSRRDLAASVNWALRERGHPSLAFEAVVAQVGHGARNLIASCLPDRKRDAKEIDAALVAFRMHYREHLTDETQPYDGIEAALASLAEQATLSVLTNKPGELARELVARLELDRYFSQVLGPDDVPLRKPDPAGLTRLLTASGTIDEGWYVGDLRVDLETARGADCRVAIVRWGYGDIASLGADADRVLDTPADLVRLLE